MAGLLSSCTSGGGNAQTAADEDCLYLSSLTEYRVIDPHHLYLEAKGRNDYLATFGEACPEAANDGVVGPRSREWFILTSGELCSNNFRT